MLQTCLFTASGINKSVTTIQENGQVEIYFSSQPAAGAREKGMQIR
jgi:hypothetical protein